MVARALAICLLIFSPSILRSDSAPVPSNAVLIDGVVTAVYGPQKTTIITYSDLQRPGIDGSPRMLDGLIDRTLKDQDAQRYGMRSSADAVEKQLQAVFRNNNWTEQDFNKMVQTVGWLPEEAREEFRILTDVNQIESFKIMSQMIVPERDIQAYYHGHPEYEEACYLVSRAVIPYDFNQDREEQKCHINNDVTHNVLDLTWSDPFWVTDQDISEDRAFIRTLALNMPSKAQETSEGFELLRVSEFKERRLKTLEEVRNSIIDILRRPKAESLQQKYSQELRSSATIVHFDEAVQSTPEP